MTDRYRDVRDTPPSVGGDQRDATALSGGSGRARRVDGHRGSRGRFWASHEAVHPRAAKLLGISRSAAYRLAESGELPVRRLGGRIYVVTAKLLDLVEAT